MSYTLAKMSRTTKNSNKNVTDEGKNLNNIWEKFELKLNNWVTTTLPMIVIKSIAGEAVKNICVIKRIKKIPCLLLYMLVG